MYSRYVEVKQPLTGCNNSGFLPFDRAHVVSNDSSSDAIHVMTLAEIA